MSSDGSEAEAEDTSVIITDGHDHMHGDEDGHHGEEGMECPEGDPRYGDCDALYEPICADYECDPQLDGYTPTAQEMSFVFGTRCVDGCHTEDGGAIYPELVLHNLDGMLWDRLVGVATNQSQLRLIDGDGTPDPHQSYVWIKAMNLQGCPVDPDDAPDDPNTAKLGTGSPMPPATEDCPFTENDIKFLERWICCGACNTEPCP